MRLRADGCEPLNWFRLILGNCRGAWSYSHIAAFLLRFLMREAHDLCLQQGLCFCYAALLFCNYFICCDRRRVTILYLHTGDLIANLF